MNIQDIADIAKVSPATVSRVMNHPDSVSPENRIRVTSVIKQFDFHPNPYAQYLAKKPKIKNYRPPSSIMGNLSLENQIR